ncbi:MAG: hypothetical protein B7Y45_04625 [Sphingomonas sp. 28-66-16]|nr:MAG: hypothetical protein B7Y45_04625 [Sphingomonas sp. 28-66-16]
MKDQQLGKVLIVEDEPLILNIAQDEFEDAGYEVIVATDGQSAIEALERHPDVRLLFTDIRMPGQPDGWDLAHRARQMLPDLTVIYATGFSGGEPRPVEGSLLFMKPYRLATIIEAARSLDGPRRHS